MPTAIYKTDNSSDFLLLTIAVVNLIHNSISIRVDNNAYNIFVKIEELLLLQEESFF